MNTKLLLALTASALLLSAVPQANAAPRTWIDPNILIDPTIPTVPGTPRPRLIPEIPTEIDPGVFAEPVTPPVERPAGLSCAAGKDLVRSMGYRRVNTVNCGSKFYVYFGERGSDRFMIRIKKSTAQVASVLRVTSHGD